MVCVDGANEKYFYRDVICIAGMEETKVMLATSNIYLSNVVAILCEYVPKCVV